MSLQAHTSVSPSVGLADGLVAAGVRRLFGIPGGGPNLEMIGAAAARDIGFTLTHGESAACVAAGAYGLLSGAAGVGLVTRGPGLTSAVNGLAQATPAQQTQVQRDGSPMQTLTILNTTTKKPDNKIPGNLPPVPSIRRCNRISLLRNVLEIKLTSEKSTTSRIGLPSLGRASAI